jgi:hypothetical protein
MGKKIFVCLMLTAMFICLLADQSSIDYQILSSENRVFKCIRFTYYDINESMFSSSSIKLNNEKDYFAFLDKKLAKYSDPGRSFQTNIIKEMGGFDKFSTKDYIKYVLKREFKNLNDNQIEAKLNNIIKNTTEIPIAPTDEQRMYERYERIYTNYMNESRIFMLNEHREKEILLKKITSDHIEIYDNKEKKLSTNYIYFASLLDINAVYDGLINLSSISEGEEHCIKEVNKDVNETITEKLIEYYNETKEFGINEEELLKKIANEKFMNVNLFQALLKCADKNILMTKYEMLYSNLLRNYNPAEYKDKFEILKNITYTIFDIYPNGINLLYSKLLKNIELKVEIYDEYSGHSEDIFRSTHLVSFFQSDNNFFISPDSLNSENNLILSQMLNEYIDQGISLLSKKSTKESDSSNNQKKLEIIKKASDEKLFFSDNWRKQKFVTDALSNKAYSFLTGSLKEKSISPESLDLTNDSVWTATNNYISERLDKDYQNYKNWVIEKFPNSDSASKLKADDEVVNILIEKIEKIKLDDFNSEYEKLVAIEKQNGNIVMKGFYIGMKKGHAEMLLKTRYPEAEIGFDFDDEGKLSGLYISEDNIEKIFGAPIPDMLRQKVRFDSWINDFKAAYKIPSFEITENLDWFYWSKENSYVIMIDWEGTRNIIRFFKKVYVPPKPAPKGKFD